MEHSENTRVKIPALVHLTRLGYKYLSLKEEKEYIHTNTNIFRLEIIMNMGSNKNPQEANEEHLMSVASWIFLNKNLKVEKKKNFLSKFD